MALRVDLSGRRFGRLVARRGFRRNGRTYWECRCDCGQAKAVPHSHLRPGGTASCGCLAREWLPGFARIGRARSFRHGKARTPEYRAWADMKNRCANPGHKGYRNYGGRGIRVCGRWRRSFAAFLKDMGPRPSPAHSIDRIDNDGHYEPGNCRWATLKEQGRNKRTCHLLTFRGKTQTIAAWAEEVGVAHCTICNRLRAGLPIERVLAPKGG